MQNEDGLQRKERFEGRKEWEDKENRGRKERGNSRLTLTSTAERNTYTSHFKETAEEQIGNNHQKEAKTGSIS